MIKKMTYFLCAAALLMAITIPVNAAQESGTIRVSLNVGDLPVTNGSFTLYRVGGKITDGYRIGEEFGGGFVAEGDAQSPHLAQWLADNTAGEGKQMLMDVDGNAVFTDLEEGLYLIVQSERTDGFYPIPPFLMTMPCKGRYHVQVNSDPLPIVMETPATGQDPAPVIGVIGLVISGVGLYLCGGNRKRWW